MSYSSTVPVIVLLLGLAFMFLILCGVVTLTTRMSIRLAKVELPKLRTLFAIAFLQTLLGGLTVFILRAINNDPLIDIGIGLGMIFLSGLFLIKLILKYGWKQCLRVWGITTVLQLIILPACSVIMVIGWVMIFLRLYPPQF
jgi:hypothetical protein